MAQPAMLQVVRTALGKAAELKPEVVPQPHQERVQAKLREDIPGLLVYHGLGSGKTLSSIMAGEEVPGPKEVIVPAALRESYRAQLERFSTKPREYHIRSYNLAAATQGQPRTGITIFDEAHRIGREESAASQLPELVHGKRVLLTGTPIRNEPSELLPILRAVSSDRPIPSSVKDFDRQFVQRTKVQPSFIGRLFGAKEETRQSLKNVAKLRALLAGRVDYHASTGAFPSVEEEHIEVPMSEAQTTLYNGLLNAQPLLAYKIRKNLPPSKAESEKLNAFMAAVRQVSNNPRSYDVSLQQEAGDDVTHSPKMQRMLEEIKKRKDQPHFRALVYSNYLESGIVPVARRLTALGVPNAVFTGELNDTERRKLVEDYNHGKLQVLLISGAGSEGLDLKGTRLVQIMEPHWNNPRLDQVVGRAVRYGSHSHLPKEQQQVQVQKFFAAPRPSLWQRLGLSSADTGADRYLHGLSARKQQLVDQVLQVLRDVGSAPAPSAKQGPA